MGTQNVEGQDPLTWYAVGVVGGVVVALAAAGVLVWKLVHG